MNGDEARSLVDRLLLAANRPQLNDLQVTILLKIWEGATSREIAQQLNYKVDYINQVAARLWKDLSICLEESVSKKNIKAVLARQQNQVENAIDSTGVDRILDWGEAIQVPQFYGRDADIKTIAQWATIDCCRSIGIFGLGGIGKTALSIKLAQRIQADFDVVIWRSLRQAPTLQSLLENVLPVLYGSEVSTISIDALMLQLRQRRCLLLFDNVESIMATGELSGSYLPGYESYEGILGRICDEPHQSCLVISSREKPGLFNLREGSQLPVRSRQLTGLPFTAAQQILDDKGTITTAQQCQLLIDHLGGNPLALKIVASNIYSSFNNNTKAFLDQGVIAFGSLWQLIDQQFQRSSCLEQQIIYWLAIMREGIQPTDLLPKLVPPASLPQILEALAILRDRSIIETTKTGLTQQPVVMEYVINRLISMITQEIITTESDLFTTHALIEAKAPDYIRNTQIQVILYPIAQQLLQYFGSIEKLGLHLRQLLEKLRERSTTSPTSLGIQELAIKANNYSVGNLLNLLCHLKIDLQNWDFSDLQVRQAYLAQVLLRNTNFTSAHFIETVFAETFGSILTVAYSPNGKLLATGSTSSEIKIWDTDTYQEVLCCSGHRHWVLSICFSPDNKYLASVCDDYLVKLWDVVTGACIRTYHGHTDSTSVVVFSPNGKLMATGAQDSTIRLWQTATIDPHVRVLVGYKNTRVWSLAFSPDGQTLASGGEDCTIRLWNVATGECFAVWIAHAAWVRSVAFSPDGQTLASGSFDYTIKIWRVDSHECLQTWKGHQNTIRSLAFSPDGSLLISASTDRTIKLWDTANGKCLKTFFGHSGALWQVAYHPHGHQVASGSEDHEIKIWDLATGTCTKTLTGHTNVILAVAASPDGAHLATAHEDRTIIIWQVKSGKILHTLRDHTNTVWSVAWSKDSEFVISGSADGTIKLWQAQTGKLLQTFHGHRSWVWSVDCAPDNLRIASGSYDQTVKIWDIATGECLQTLLGHTASVASLDFSPDGKLLASGSFDNTIRIWNVETGECDTAAPTLCERVITTHENSIWSLTFSPDGQYLLSSSFDRTLKLWDVKTWKCLRTYQGHRTFIKTVKFTPDGRQIVSGGFEGELKVWDVESGECLQTLVGHQELIYMVDVTRTKMTESTAPRLLAFTSSIDETIRVWDLESFECTDTWKPPRPYEGMSIDNITGINESQVSSLKALGAKHPNFTSK